MPNPHSALELVGERYGQLTIESRAGTDSRRYSLWNCRCDCGFELLVSSKSLRSKQAIPECRACRKNRRLKPKPGCPVCGVAVKSELCRGCKKALRYRPPAIPSPSPCMFRDCTKPQVSSSYKGLCVRHNSLCRTCHERPRRSKYGQCRSCKRDVNKAAYYADLEASRARVREYARSDGRVSRAAWAANNRDKVRQSAKMQDYRRKGAKGSFKLTEWREIIARQGGKCNYCGSEEKLTVDHIWPIAKGGTNWPWNLQGLCRSCNSQKSASLTAKELRLLAGRAHAILDRSLSSLPRLATAGSADHPRSY